MTKLNNRSQSFHASAEFQAAKQKLLSAIQTASRSITGLKATTDPEVRGAYLKEVERVGALRGRPLYYPAIYSGLGNGPFAELQDGSVKYDMITGIGINFFGHSHPALMEEAVNAVTSDTMQGNLLPGSEGAELVDLLLSKVSQSTRLKHAWITTCGTMANEIALKAVRQKKFPATKILAFRDCFAGRSTAMQEITDTPGYREGQPVYGEIYYLPHYQPEKGLEISTQETLAAMKDHLSRYPGKFAALMMELVQGEGGFVYGPKDYYVRIFEEAKKAGLAIWADEIQTFGRTGELFAFETLDVGEYVDVVTAAKLLQTAVVLYTQDFNPKPGLVAGTFSGSSSSLRAARRTVEELCGGGYLGREGKVSKLAARFQRNLDALASGSCKGLIGERRVLGGMIAFSALDGSADQIKKLIMALFDAGMMTYVCGHGPYFVRLLPPMAAMTEAHVDDVCKIIGETLVQTAASLKSGSKG